MNPANIMPVIIPAFAIVATKMHLGADWILYLLSTFQLSEMYLKSEIR